MDIYKRKRQGVGSLSTSTNNASGIDRGVGMECGAVMGVFQRAGSLSTAFSNE
jgi:hypothetical protein